MRLWIKWLVMLAVYGLLNYLFVWMGSPPGIGAYFMWGTTLPFTVIVIWGAILLPRRQKLRYKWVLGLLTVMVYGSLGFLSCWTIWTHIAPD